MNVIETICYAIVVCGEGRGGGGGWWLQLSSLRVRGWAGGSIMSAGVQGCVIRFRDVGKLGNSDPLMLTPDL